MATIKDVAAKAGVSTATVSRVLKKSGDVTDKTRRKVENAIKELRYHPDAMARFLQSGRSYLIGILLPELDHLYFARLLQAVEHVSAAHGYRLLIGVSEGDMDKEIQFAGTLRRNKADGLIVCSRTKNDAFFADYHVPVVTIEHIIGDAVPSVCCDNYAGGVLAAQALLDGGCHHPLVLGEQPDRRHLPAHLRIEGFTDECTRRGVPCTVYNGDKAKAEKSETYRDFFKELLDTYPDTDGMFTTSDQIAARANTAFGAMGLHIPEQIQLVGFDGLEVAEYLGITTVVQPIVQMGEFAVDMLLKLAGGNLIPTQSVMPVSLVKRRSTRI